MAPLPATHRVNRLGPPAGARGASRVAGQGCDRLASGEPIAACRDSAPIAPIACQARAYRVWQAIGRRWPVAIRKTPGMVPGATT